MGIAFEPEQWITRNGLSVARAMFPSGDLPGDFAVQVVSHKQGRAVMRLSAGGTSVAVKAFDPVCRGASAAAAREFAVMKALAGSGLAPAPIAMRRTEPFVISDWIVGSPLSDRLDADRAKGFARQLGAWLAAYSGQMDSHGVDAALNWRDYLSKYEIFKENEMRDPELAFLRDLPLKRQIVARNDAAPANWIVTDNGTLCGIDFEAAALKPYGWDVLLAARDLARRFPVAALGLCDALIDGWDHGTESLPKSTFRQLVHLFACRTVSHTTRPCPI